MKIKKLIVGVLACSLIAASMLGCSAKAAEPATKDTEVQNIVSQVTRSGYEPITVKAGVPVKWTLQAEKADLTGCNSAISIPEYKIVKKLKAGDNVIEFTPTKSGVVPFSCWMGMINSEINVVDELQESEVGKTKLAAVAKESTSEITQELADETANGVIEAKIAPSGYPVIVVEVGKTTQINFKAEQADLNSCNSEIIIPEFEIDKMLVVGDNIVSITPTEVGEIAYGCWMGMISSKIIVVEAGTEKVGARPMDETAYQANSGCSMMLGGNVNDNPSGCCGGTW